MDSTTSEQEKRFDVSPNYKWYVLFVLTGVYVFNFIDRQILVIIQESIKEELLLSDAQLGLLTGFTFAVFYVTLGIPIARLADRTNRKRVVAISLVIWSGMTVISGRAMNFLQLLLARIGVGIGEAGGSPPAHSIVSDYFPPKNRATALSIYSTGVYIGIFVGYLVGGYIDKMYGWRVALYAMGIPGILYAILVYFTVKEPIRGMSDPGGLKGKSDISIREVVNILLSKKTFIFLAFATGFHAFTTYGVGNFTPSFLARVHGMDKAAIGLYAGLAAGLGGGVGTFLGGYLPDRFRKFDIRRYLWISMASLALRVPFSLTVFFASNTTLVVGAMIMSTFCSGIYLGPSIAVTHSLVDARMRAFASAILFFALNMIGLGLGPLMIGWISDLLVPTFGAESLRYAFCFSFIITAASFLMFWLASKHYKEELEEGAN